MQEKMLLKVPDAADKYDISRAFMAKLIASGEIKSIKLGKSRRVPVSELEAYITRVLAEQNEAAE